MKRALRIHPFSQGFTLMETLIALGIFALVGTLTYGVFARTVDARNQALTITSHYHQIRQAMQRMSSEISMAFLSAHKDCEEERTQTIFKTDQAHGGMRLDFTSFSHTKFRADANESDQNELSYFLDTHPDDPKVSVLMRREQNRIDDDPEEGGRVQVMAENVVGLEFEFYDPKDDEWVDEWDSTNMDYRHRLPMFVTIRMKAEDPAGKEELFVTKTRIFVQREILITGTGHSRCPD